MVERDTIRQKVAQLLNELADLPLTSIDDGSPLVGSRAVVKSRTLVELMLALEEYCEDDLGVTFDWSSDTAMSGSRSLMRNVGSLVDHLYGLQLPK